MNRSRFHVATPQIVSFFDGLPIKIHRRSDIAEHLNQQRSAWRLSEPTSTQKFMPSPASRWPVEVVSPQGWIVRLQNSSDVQQLPALLRALPC